jgi:hypothetical protein
MIHHLPQYVTVEEYAKLCGIKVYTVYKREKLKTVSLFHIGKKRFVDITHNPLVHSFRAQKGSAPRALPASLKEKMAAHITPPPQGLTAVKDIAKKLNKRTDSIYELIIGNKLDAWHIGAITFVQETAYLEVMESIKTEQVSAYKVPRRPAKRWYMK